MNDYERYLAVGAALFVLGAIGFLTRRNLILLFLSAEMMLYGVSLTFVTFGRMHHTLEGQAFTIFVLTVSACEAGLALSLILALYQRSQTLDVDFWTALREPDLPSPAARDEFDESSVQEPEQGYPQLTPAGLRPLVPADAAATTGRIPRSAVGQESGTIRTSSPKSALKELPIGRT